MDRSHGKWIDTMANRVYAASFFKEKNKSNFLFPFSCARSLLSFQVAIHAFQVNQFSVLSLENGQFSVKV